MTGKTRFYGWDSVDSIQIYTNDIDGCGVIEILGNRDALDSIRPDEAEHIAEALIRAAAHARTLRTPLDKFLEKRK